jgi:hypothetical protein
MQFGTDMPELMQDCPAKNAENIPGLKYRAGRDDHLKMMNCKLSTRKCSNFDFTTIKFLVT